MSKSASFLGLSDGMMARALHSSKFASPGTELPKFRSHLTDIQLGLGDVMPTFPFLQPSSHTGAASESLPLLPSLQSDKLDPNSFGNFFVGPAERFGRDNLPLEQPFNHSFYSGSLGASGMDFSSNCNLQQDDDVLARNKRMKLPSLLEKSLSYLREIQGIHSEESKMGQLRDVKRKQAASLVDDIPSISKENKLPHWLQEAVSAPRPLETALTPSISAISHSICILFGENKFTIPPFIVPGTPTSLPKDPRKRLRKKRKANRFQHTIPENSNPTGNTDAMMSSSIHQSQSSAPSLPSAILPASTFLSSSSQSSSVIFGSISPVSPVINCSIPADSPPTSCTILLAPPLTGCSPGLTRKDTGFILPSLNLNLNLPTSSSYGTQGMQPHGIPSPSPAACMDHTQSVSDMPITSNQNLECAASDNPGYSQVGVDLIVDINYIPYETEGNYELTCSLPGEMEC
ncbi:hypothetical protein KSP40_PGU008285 [Platanthera guangdongensis]|uniref:Uncharacterized protein n=1 Tax=Platanthera guangdongensis TaxID=2320717 RepID=A0ABR2MDK6_9ASPA